ncbi:AraC family transcriptional regulator [Myxococcus stipitatus DSM 14675]|uniref:AraC family transcriptional regulator n=1 Tax=Myxococcus stipitatus (strain DSM 14675 / JCM 12634 / Mx s8) TaxID=1278073 RepID=L7U7G3_MYXSD|nr:GlxA family transcriptional regulator [Myxococcus stipitatus]AGC43502.1 AraC family transcriptional regulator [Myxococcus stipitatus DSM 14675]
MGAAIRRVGFLGYEGVEALDLVGPMEAFAKVQTGGQRRYEVLMVGLHSGEFRSESGLVFKPHLRLEDARGLDTLLISGGAGLRRPAANAQVVRWLQSHAHTVRRVVSVCTGIYALAASGLLDGRRATTHWQFAQDVAARFPKVRLEPDALFIQDGTFYTSAGITAGIDLALALIEEDHGPRAALTVAREMVMYLKRPGGQAQYSEPLRFQEESGGRLGDLTSWMLVNLAGDLSVEALAQRACLSPRHFARQFRTAFGQTPAAYVEQLRMEEARRRLGEGDSGIEQVALAVGFQSADVFRRAFERRFGVAPSTYRRGFGAHEEQPRAPRRAPRRMAR